jgi:hypothetical protein
MLMFEFEEKLRELYREFAAMEEVKASALEDLTMANTSVSPAAEEYRRSAKQKRVKIGDFINGLEPAHQAGAHQLLLGTWRA